MEALQIGRSIKVQSVLILSKDFHKAQYQINAPINGKPERGRGWALGRDFDIFVKEITANSPPLGQNNWSKSPPNGKWRWSNVLQV